MQHNTDRTRDRHDSGVSLSPPVRGSALYRRPSILLKNILQTSEPRLTIKQNKTNDSPDILTLSPRSKDSEEESPSQLNEPEEFSDNVFVWPNADSKTVGSRTLPPSQTMLNLPVRTTDRALKLNISTSFDDDGHTLRNGGNQIASSATLHSTKQRGVSESDRNLQQVTVSQPIIRRNQTDSSVDREVLRRRKAMKRTSTWDLNPREFNVQV